MVRDTKNNSPHHHPDVTRGEMLLLHHGEIEQLVLLSGMLINKKLVWSHFEVCQDNWHEYVDDVGFYRYNSILAMSGMCNIVYILST